MDNTKHWNNLVSASSQVLFHTESIQEYGHTDVASALGGIRIAKEALNNMEEILKGMNPEDDLPSWWTNQVAVSVSQLDDMADILKKKVEK